MERKLMSSPLPQMGTPLAAASPSSSSAASAAFAKSFFSRTETPRAGGRRIMRFPGWASPSNSQTGRWGQQPQRQPSPSRYEPMMMSERQRRRISRMESMKVSSNQGLATGGYHAEADASVEYVGFGGRGYVGGRGYASGGGYVGGAEESKEVDPPAHEATQMMIDRLQTIQTISASAAARGARARTLNPRTAPVRSVFDDSESFTESTIITNTATNEEKYAALSLKICNNQDELGILSCWKR